MCTTGKFWTMLALAGVLAALAFPTLSAADEKAVAVVNGERLGEQAFLDTLRARYGERVLSSLITGLAVRQAAKAAGVVVTQEELARRYEANERLVEMRAPMTGENFDLWLAKRGLTREYFRSEMYQQMLLEKMVQAQVKVTDADVSAYYQRNKDQLAEPAQVRVAHICLQTQKEADQIRADILAGKVDWNEAAKKYSLDPWTKDNGGDMGFVALSDTPFHQAAFALKANGDISAPVKSPMGFHIIKRLAYREGRIPPYEELEATIREQMEHSQLVQLAQQKRQDILKAAKIEGVIKMAPEAAPPAAPSPKPPTAPTP
jgi:foldase protein PrsA